MERKWVHQLTNLDPAKRKALCAECGPVRIQSKGKGQWGCGVAASSRQNKRRKPWRLAKKDYCESPTCKSVVEHPCQLDVDHVDGDKKNNDPSNLMTLCANCHRLKTMVNEDWTTKSSLSVT